MRADKFFGPFLVCCVLYGSLAVTAAAQTGLRELSTDRPDTTESPYSVDAGHFQIEMSAVEYLRDRSGGSTLEETTVVPFNFKYGLTDSSDLQLVMEPFLISDETGSSAEEGIGDLTVRLKINLWGNDGGETAGGVMPFIKIPTGSDAVTNGDVEGGLIVPFAFDLGDGWGAGLMAEVDLVRQEESSGYAVAFVHTGTIAVPVTDELGAFVEYAGETSSDKAVEYVSTINAGITYALAEFSQLDAGIRVGMQERAPDIQAFWGYSQKF